MKIKKITAIAGSILMAGLTIATSAAASFPAPFVDNGKADVAIVYGSTADSVAATNVHTALGTFAVSEGATTVIGGESYMFEKTSTKYHLGDAITSVVSTSLDEDELPGLLADGKFIDDDNDEFDFEQKITMQASQLIMFEDNDYEADAPTVGFKFSSAANVLDYTLTFTEEPLFTDLGTTDLTFMGKEYYVLTATRTVLTLLDSAADTIIAEGESVVINAGGKTYTVSIEFVDADSAKLNVNGEVTNDISLSETYKLSDGSYLGLKEILYSAKDTGVSKVELSIGSGKLVLTSGSDVELNEDTIDELTATIVNSSDGLSLTSISLDWDAEDELFVTETSEITMPGFEAVKLSYIGLDYPTTEVVEVNAGSSDYIVLDNFPLKDSVEDIPMLYADGTNFIGIGKDTDEGLITGAESVTFDSDLHSYFIVSWADSRDAESYLARATNFKIDNSINKTTIQYRKDGAWTDAKTDRVNGDTFSIGNAELVLGAINKLGKNVVISNNSVQTNFNTLYSAEGLKVNFPVQNATATTGIANDTQYLTANAALLAARSLGAVEFYTGDITFNKTGGVIDVTEAFITTTFDLVFTEEDKDGDLAAGSTITVPLALNAQSPQEVTVGTVTSSGTLAGKQEIGESDVFRDFVYGALATEILTDTNGDQDSVKINYHGDEVSASVYITSADATTTSSATTDFLPVMASEIGNVQSKNLVIVGGSCINAAAATVLGGAYCGDAFTAATGVAANEFMIKGVMGAFSAGKLALVVAGYEAADTAMAVTYLTKKDVDTSSSAIYTTATNVELVAMKQ